MVPFSNQHEFGGEDVIGLVGYALGSTSMIPVPLLGVSVDAQILDFIAEVKLSQCYHNTGDFPIEATYHFPVDEAAAVCGFEAAYEDGTIVKGVVKEKNQARQEFNHAIQQGKQANLLEAVRRDVFTLKVGNIPANEHVKITITYITSLKARDDAAAFILPTYIAARYVPREEGLSRADAEALTQSPNNNVTVKFFGVDICIQFTCRSDIKSVTSPTHEYEPSLACSYHGTKGRLLLRNAAMDRDLVVLLEEEQSHQPRVVIEESETGTLAGFVTLFPQLEFPDLKREFVFLIDRSGSMRGRKMSQARETLLLFLRCLPVSSSFNIISFGSNFSSQFRVPQPYNDETLDCASRHVMNMEANLGGTEICEPLRHIFSQVPPPGVERQLFVLTDGQVSNDLQVFDIIRQNCVGGTKCRLFSVGLGTGVSRHLVAGMARAGFGTSRFVEEGEESALQKKVLGQLKQALQPSIHNVTIEWQCPPKSPPVVAEQPPVKTLLGYRSPSVDNEIPVDTSAPKIFPTANPPIFNREKFLSFALFPSGSEMPTSVTVACETSDGKLETTLPISADDLFHGTIAHKMAARAAISEHEDTRTTRSGLLSQSRSHGVLSEADALQLALANSLVSEKTSFIAIREIPFDKLGGVVYVGADGTQVRPVAKQPATTLAPVESEGEVYMRPDGKKIRRVKKKPSTGTTLAPVEFERESYTRPDGKKVRRVMKKPGIATMLAPASATTILAPVEFEGEIYIRADGKKVRRVKKKPATTLGAKTEPETEEGRGVNTICDDGQKVRRSRGNQNIPAGDIPDGAVDFSNFLDVRREIIHRAEGTKVRVKQQSHNGESMSPDEGRITQKIAVAEECQKMEQEKEQQQPGSGNQLLDLCLLQKANGSFQLDNALIQVLGLTKTALDEISAAARSCCNAVVGKEGVLGTALAVAAMRVLFPSDKTLWELQEDKALAFLASQGLSRPEIEGLLCTIQSFLTNQ